MTQEEKRKNVNDAMQSNHVQAVVASFEYEADDIRYYSAITTKNNIPHKYTVRVQDWFENGEKQRIGTCNCAAGQSQQVCRHIVRVAELDTERTGATLFLDNLANYKAHKIAPRKASFSNGLKTESCGCVYNWNDKFYESLCNYHAMQNEAAYEADRQEIRFAA